MKKRVAILCGGRSSEHEISCISAQGIMGAIDRTAYEPILIGITKAGRWVLIPEGHTFAISGDLLPTVPEGAQQVIADVAGFFVDGRKLEIDIVFPMLHGPFGEDGTIQGFLEMANLPYVGSGVLASAVAMDKSFAKPIFAAHGIATARGVVVKRNEWTENAASLTDQIKQLGFPVFVKPARGGSSRGTSKVKSESELTSAINEAFTFDSKIMVEEAIVGAEIECAVLEIKGTPRASIPGQVSIDPRFEFYDFEAKYLDGATDIIVPAPISESILARVQSAAVQAFRALGCSGLARVDFFLTHSGDIVINELNTMPGFTKTSVFPKMWSASGVAFTQVITHVLEAALTRSNATLGN
jgi:D-alanine-D-alanine ligase